jgi:hypothetical protein
MYDGVKAMIAAEKALGGGGTAPAAAAAAGPAANVECGSHLVKPEQITGPPVWPEGTKSLVCKYVTPERFTKF